MASKTKTKPPTKKAPKIKPIKTVKPVPKTQPEVKEVDQLTKLWWGLKPEKEDTGAALWHHFVSDCGRYQLSRIDSQTRDSVVWAACYLKGKAWDTIYSVDVPQHAPLFYKTATEALKAIEGYHCDRMKIHMDKVKTNSEDLLRSVEELPLPIHQGQPKQPKTNRSKQPKPVKQHASVSNQTKDGQPDKPAKPSRDKGDVARDAFGCRTDSQVAKINAALTDVPKSVKDITQEVGCSTSAAHGHLYNMVRKGLISKTDKGYTLLPKA